MTEYSDHFTVEELQCPTAKIIKCAPGFINNLEALRVEYGKGMTVTSGCRTDDHNEWLIERGYAASPSSLHLIENAKYKTDTHAIDFKWPAPQDVHRFVTIATRRGWSIRFAKTFIHIDLRTIYAGLPPHIGIY